MTDIVLNHITNPSNVSLMNNNFDKIEDSINNDVLHLDGGNNTMLQQLDMNGHKIINLATDANDPNSLLTVDAGDARYYNVSGDTLTGQMNANSQRIINLPAPASDTEPMRRVDVLAIDSGNADQLKVDLANSTDTTKGAKLVGYAGDTVAGELDAEKAVRQGNLTDFYSRKAAWTDPEVYVAWPFTAGFQDIVSGSEFIMQAYTAGSAHNANDKKVYFRRMAMGPDPSFGGRILIADFTGEGYGCFTHACGKCANGDYLAIVNVVQYPAGSVIKTIVFRSTDKGLNWVSEGQWTRNDAALLKPSEASGMYLTSTGRLLTWYRRGDNNLSRVVYSDNNGLTWFDQGADINPANPGALEGSFLELDGGKIAVLVRKSVGSEPYTVAQPALYSISPDNGSTWPELQATNLTDMSYCPGMMLYHAEEGVIEAYYGSRLPQGDGSASLYQAVTTRQDILTGTFRSIRRTPLPRGTKDSGYPCVSKSTSGRVFLTFYNGGTDRAQIQQLEGARPRAGQSGTRGVQVPTLNNPMNGGNHIEWRSGGQDSSGRQLLRFTNLEGLHHTSFNASVAVTRMGMEYLFSDGNATTVFTGAPVSNAFDVDVKTALGSKYNQFIGGYVIEVIMTTNSTSQIQIQIGNDDTKKRILRTYPVIEAVGKTFEENIEMTVPTYKQGAVKEGQLRVLINDFTRVNNLVIRVRGYLPINGL